MDPDDLLDRTFEAVLQGQRRCPRGGDFMKSLIFIMRSIGSNDYNLRKRQSRSSKAPLMGGDGGQDVADESPTAEEALVLSQDASAKAQAIRTILRNDAGMLAIVEHALDGLRGEELRKATGLNRREFDTKRRLIRRRFERAIRNGWKP